MISDICFRLVSMGIQPKALGDMLAPHLAMSLRLPGSDHPP